MKWLTLFFYPVWLFAIPLESLIEHASKNHTSLTSLEQRVAAIDHEYAVSQNFADPTISLAVSNIQLKDATNRSLEPMQYTAINLSQKIPYFGKRDALGNKISAKKEKIALSVDSMKVKIIREIKINAYSIWQKEEELKITGEYIKLTQQNIELYSAFTSSDSKSHMSIMSAEMSLSELKIKQSRIKSTLKGLYKKISYLSGVDVTNVEVTTKLFKPNPLTVYTQTSTKNVTYKIKQATLNEANLDIQVKALESNIDPVVNLGYFQRESYEDYINIAISFKVPLYSTQEHKTEYARKISLASKSDLQDYDNLLLAQITDVHAQLENAYEVHRIIMHESMPQIEHMFELSSSSIKSGDELFLYIDLLEKKLSLDEKNITVVATYHKNQAILDALIGEMR